MTALQCRGEKLRSLAAVVGNAVFDQHPAAGRRAERCKPLSLRPVDQVDTVGVQTIKKEGIDGQLVAHCLDVGLAAKSAHRDLERQRPAVFL